jgi:flagellar biosynthetic protein FlhB
MAEEHDLERTEPASHRRLEQAREEGQIARSRELSTFAVLTAASAGLWLMGAGLFERLSASFGGGLKLTRAQAFDTELALVRFVTQVFEIFPTCVPLLGLLFSAALISPMLLNGWILSWQPLKPDLARLNPFKGLSRLFSAAALAELLKALLKALLVGVVSALLVRHQYEAVLALSADSPEPAVAQLGNLLGFGFLLLTGSTLAIVAFDVPFQLWEHRRKLRMSREELRREAKETEGDPQVKARIRSLQRDRARRRMMEQIPKADVIVTNPTHYAVALQYQEGLMRAPRVLAKGAALLATRIREIGEQHRITILHAPPLARALYHHTEIGDEIPQALYNAVAEVLAYVFQLRRHHEYGAPAPRAPEDLPVPPELDPQSNPE